MSLVDIVILVVIAVAFAAVCIRIKRKGSCADCAQGASCSGNCSSAQRRNCPACKGIDRVTEELGRGVR